MWISRNHSSIVILPDKDIASIYTVADPEHHLKGEEYFLNSWNCLAFFCSCPQKFSKISQIGPFFFALTSKHSVKNVIFTLIFRDPCSSHPHPSLIYVEFSSTSYTGRILSRVGYLKNSPFWFVYLQNFWATLKASSYIKLLIWKPLRSFGHDEFCVQMLQ